MVEESAVSVERNVWECVDNHGNTFLKNSLTMIGQHVIAFWPYIEEAAKAAIQEEGEENEH